MKNKTRADISDRGYACSFVILLHIFFQNRKLHRTDCQNLAVKFPDIEGAAGFFLLFLFQIKEVQITEIIFKIVTGSFNNILIDLTGDLCISDSEDLQKSQSGSLIPTLIMNARIKQRIDTEIDTAVFPHQGGEVGSRFVCEKRSSILISVGFDISCPAFDIAARK